MPNADYTHLTVVLDRSGSMDDRITDSIGGFNAMLAEQQRLPGACDLKVVQFDDTFELIYDGPIAAAKPLDNTVHFARGSTALRDALGRVITENGARFAAMTEGDRPGKVMVTVFTDGLENSSSQFSPEALRAMVAEHQSVYSWTFVFLGADQATALQGEALGIANSFRYDVDTTAGYATAYAGVNRVFERARSAAPGMNVAMSQADFQVAPDPPPDPTAQATPELGGEA